MGKILKLFIYASNLLAYSMNAKMVYNKIVSVPDRTTDFDRLAGVKLHDSAFHGKRFPGYTIPILGADRNRLSGFQFTLRFFVTLVVPVLEFNFNYIKSHCVTIS